MAKINWSDLAEEHLREIDSYVSQGSPFYSIIFIDKLIDSVEKISLFPKSGRIVPEFSREDIREIFFHDYRIIYLIRNDEIIVLAVVHGAREFGLF